MKKKQQKGKYLKVFSIKKKSIMDNHQNGLAREQHSHDEDMIKRVARKLEVAARTPKRNNLHIIARGEHWIIKREGASKAYRIFETLAEAIKNAKAMILRGSAEQITIHDDDGKVARRM